MNTTITNKNPAWWSTDEDSAWERVKDTFKRDWDQATKRAARRDAAPPQGMPAYEEVETAYRFGYGARLHYGDKYDEWDDELEDTLRRDWLKTYPDRNWDEDVEYIQAGWDYEQ